MDRVCRRQQRAVGLQLQFAVGALHVALGKSFATVAQQPDVVGRHRHAPIHDPRTALQGQRVIRRRVGGALGKTGTPAQFALGTFALPVTEVALLDHP